MPRVPHILLIDDDDVNNFLNSRLLKRMAVAEQVHVASSSQKALTFLADQQLTDAPATLLIFLDINMPIMNGFEFLDQLRTHDLQHLTLVIVMLTTSTNDKDLDQVKSYPEVLTFLNKPLSEEKVEAVLDAHFPARS